MAANITITSPSLSSDGKTLTATIAGGNGSGYSISDATGLIPSITTNGGAHYPISSVSITGTILTINIGCPIASDDTVTLDVLTSATITDGSGNTPTGQTSLAVANDSSRSTTRCLATNSAIKIYGRAITSNPSYVQLVVGAEATFVLNGTDATAILLTNGSIAVSVDGGAFVTVGAWVNNGTLNVYPLFVSLAAEDHAVVIKDIGTTYLSVPNAVQIFGGSGAISAPGTNDGQGYGPYTILLSGANYVDTGSWLPTNILGANPSALGNQGIAPDDVAWSDATLRFSGCGTKLRVWIYNSQSFHWEIDGVGQTPVTLTSDSPSGAWGWALFSSLDGQFHTYKIEPDGGSNYIDAVMFVGSSASFGSPVPPLPGLAGYGHSQMIPASLDSRQGILSLVARNLNETPYNRAIGGTLIAGNADGEAGEARTADVTGIVPEVKQNIILYGTNDLTAPGDGSTPSSSFGTATQIMLTDLLVGTTATVHYVLGIFPRTGFSSGTIVAWNGAGNGIQGSVAAVKTAMPSSAGRLIYIDPTPWQLNGVSSSDYSTNYIDGLHLNAAGNAIVASALTTLIADSISATPTTVERGEPNLIITLSGTGIDFNTAVASNFMLTGSTITGYNQTTQVLTFTASSNTGTLTLTHVPTGATCSITCVDTTPPPNPTGVTGGTATPTGSTYSFTISWNSQTDTYGGSVTYRVYKNGTELTTAPGQSGTTYAITGADLLDVFTVTAQDASGNISGATAYTFQIPFPTNINLTTYPTISVSGASLGDISQIDQNQHQFIEEQNLAGPVTVTMASPYTNSEIRYSLNGKGPHKTSYLYTESLVFTQDGSGSEHTGIKARIYDLANANNKSIIIRLNFRVI
jgi:lysophospholipase L1-like esterase